jgi:hypothetical protein
MSIYLYIYVWQDEVLDDLKFMFQLEVGTTSPEARTNCSPEQIRAIHHQRQQFLLLMLRFPDLEDDAFAIDSSIADEDEFEFGEEGNGRIDAEERVNCSGGMLPPTFQHHARTPIMPPTRVLALTALLLLVSHGCDPSGGPIQAAPPGNAAAPAKADVLFSESFDDARLLERGWYDGSRFKISEQAAHAGKGCIEYHWQRGGTTPDTSQVLRRLFEPAETVYLRFYIKLSKGWGWTGRSYHPHLIQFMTTENGKYHGPAASHLTLYVEPQEGKLRLAAQDIQNKDRPHGLTQGPLRGGYNGIFYDSKETLFTDDRWHCVEAQFKLNSLDLARDRPNADGEARAWFDGKPVVERADVVFRSTDFPRMRINQLLLAPYFGPGLLPREQTLWIDELVVGRRRSDPKAG